MLEVVLIIILLPIAIISLVLLSLGVFLVWKYILAIITWLIAGGIFLDWKYASTNNDLKWWALGFFIAGCLFWAEAGETQLKKTTDRVELE